MVIRAFKKYDATTEEGGSENHQVHLQEINYVMPHPEEEFHLETQNDENTDSSYSAHDTMSSSDSDEDNEPTPESYYFIAQNSCITKKFFLNLKTLYS